MGGAAPAGGAVAGVPHSAGCEASEHMGEGRRDRTRRPPPYQCTPFIRCAKATASVDGALSGASSAFPFAAWDSGNSL